MKVVNNRIASANACLGLVASLLMSSATAQQPYGQPTDNDLHAAYCLSVSQTALAEMQATRSQILANGGAGSKLDSATSSGINELSSRVNRLRAYVLPKMVANDDAVIGLAAAAQRGRQDWATLSTDEKINACNRACAAFSTRNAPNDDKAVTECVQSCAPEISQRLHTCTDLSWLPF